VKRRLRKFSDKTVSNADFCISALTLSTQRCRKMNIFSATHPRKSSRKIAESFTEKVIALSVNIDESRIVTFKSEIKNKSNFFKYRFSIGERKQVL